MNIFSICCFGFVIVAILGLVIYALIKKVQSLKLENTRLNTALSSAKEIWRRRILIIRRLIK